MLKLEVGQELEFIEPARVDDRMIDKGTRVRVGFILDEVIEPKVTIVLLGTEPPQTLSVPRHILAMHCVPARQYG
ncbi:MAG: hypothetical protein ABI648_03895 [Betaproteobacteria bacterium]